MHFGRSPSVLRAHLTHGSSLWKPALQSGSAREREMRCPINSGATAVIATLIALRTAVAASPSAPARRSARAISASVATRTWSSPASLAFCNASAVMPALAYTVVRQHCAAHIMLGSPQDRQVVAERLRDLHGLAERCLRRRPEPASCR